MSFDIFVQCFKDSQSDVVSCQEVRDVFGSFLTEGGPFDWQLDYDKENTCDVIFEYDEEDRTMLHGFSVVRPCADERFWDAIVSVLKLGNLVLFMPADCPPFIGDGKIDRHLPSDMLEDMGQPKCVTTGKDILDAFDTA